MKLTKYRSDHERSVLTGMIVNTQVLARIHSHIATERNPFRSKWANIISKWCLEFYKKFQSAPRADIQTLFRRYAETADDSSIELVEKFLSSLSEDHAGLSREINVDFLLDVAGKLFTSVKLEKLSESIAAKVQDQDLDAAVHECASFAPIQLATTSEVDFMTDIAPSKDAITVTESDVLVYYPKALGEFFGPHLERDGFIAFMGPEKRGKTFWLMDVAWRAAVNSKRKTLFYSVGDMSQRQMLRRFIARAAQRPIGSELVKFPTSLVGGREGWIVKTRCEEFNESITFAELKQAITAVRKKTASNRSLLKLKSTFSMRVADIRNDVDRFARGGWVPDVIVIDYADVLMPEAGSAGFDYRNQINETWKALRRLSLEYHCLVVTASQTDTASYGAEVIRRSNFSEDKRKLSHVTGIVGINQTEGEKEKGIYRLNWVLLREGLYFESRCVGAAGSLAICNPSMKSAWQDKEEAD